MKRKTKSAKKVSRSVTHRANSSAHGSQQQTPTKPMMIIVSLIGGGVAWLLSGNFGLGITVFAAIGLGNWLVYHKGMSI